MTTKSPSKRARSPSPCASIGSDGFAASSPVRMQLKNTFLHLTLAEGGDQIDIGPSPRRSKSLSAIDMRQLFNTDGDDTEKKRRGSRGQPKKRNDQIRFSGELSSEHSFYMEHSDDEGGGHPYAASDDGQFHGSAGDGPNQNASEKDLEEDFVMTGLDLEGDDNAGGRGSSRTPSNKKKHQHQQGRGRDRERKAAPAPDPLGLLADHIKTAILREQPDGGWVKTETVLWRVWSKIAATMDTPQCGFSTDRFATFLEQFNKFDTRKDANGDHQVRVSQHLAAGNGAASANLGRPPVPPPPPVQNHIYRSSTGNLADLRSPSPVFTPMQTSPVLQGHPGQPVMQFSLNQQGMLPQQVHMQGMMSPPMMASPRSSGSTPQPQGAASPPMMATPVMVQSPRGLQQAVIMTPVQVGTMQQAQMQAASPRLQVSQGGQPPPPLPPQQQQQQPGQNSMNMNTNQQQQQNMQQQQQKPPPPAPPSGGMNANQMSPRLDLKMFF